MSNKLDSLSEDEVRQISLLVETLDRSSFDYLQVEVGNLKVTIGKGGAPQTPAAGAGPSEAASGVPAGAPQAAAAPAVAAPHPSAPAPTPAATGENPAQDGTVAIVAPLMGRFYAKPEPGAAPFVSVGAEVTEDNTVGLIEVMKVFTAVRAGVGGVVTEICVQDAEFVEYGRILFRVRPATAAAEPSPVRAPRKGART